MNVDHIYICIYSQKPQRNEQVKSLATVKRGNQTDINLKFPAIKNDKYFIQS